MGLHRCPTHNMRCAQGTPRHFGWRYFITYGNVQRDLYLSRIILPKEYTASALEVKSTNTMRGTCKWSPSLLLLLFLLVFFPFIPFTMPQPLSRCANNRHRNACAATKYYL